MRGQSRRRTARRSACPETAAKLPLATKESTAIVVSLMTSSGCETIATWLLATSTVVAPMRLAKRRSASGGMA